MPAHHRAASALDAYLEAAELEEEPKMPLFQTMDPAARRLTGRALNGRLVLALIKRRCPALDMLPHAEGDGDQGVLAERRDPRARATDRRPRVAEDDEALRPDGGHRHGRRDRAHRDLKGGACPRACGFQPSATVSGGRSERS